jgi:hypothetical protein
MMAQPMGGYIALVAIVAGMVIYRVVWFLGRERARRARERSRGQLRRIR